MGVEKACCMWTEASTLCGPSLRAGTGHGIKPTVACRWAIGKGVDDPNA